MPELSYQAPLKLKYGVDHGPFSTRLFRADLPLTPGGWAYSEFMISLNHYLPTPTRAAYCTFVADFEWAAQGQHCLSTMVFELQDENFGSLLAYPIGGHNIECKFASHQTLSGILPGPGGNFPRALFDSSANARMIVRCEFDSC